MRELELLNTHVKFVVIFLVILLNFNLTFGQNCYSADYFDELRVDLVSLFNTTNSQIHLFSLGAFSFAFDGPINESIPRSDFLEVLNDIDIFDFALISVVVSGLILPFDSYTAWTVIESFTVSALITGTIKFLLGRARPYVSDNPFVFKFFSMKDAYQSFPSGHTTLSWAIFTPVAERFGKFWYVVPSMFSLQRLWSKNHWFSDVYYGLLLGYTTGYSLYYSRSE
ncbi:phosphatase PAP2 family protein [Fervidobacterium pennivorans subsp. shakshaketiis]|jgi:membrane-associated phospholipid phosphatase|uniref:phosphatase PAP2 family protein n=1 Tax=Fervidobacterium pennivorans TaxID=93466 RepID=UPI00355AF5A8